MCFNDSGRLENSLSELSVIVEKIKEVEKRVAKAFLEKWGSSEIQSWESDELKVCVVQRGGWKTGWTE